MTGLSHLFAASSISINFCLSHWIWWNTDIPQSGISALLLGLICPSFVHTSSSKLHCRATIVDLINHILIESFFLDIPNNLHVFSFPLFLMGSLCRFLSCYSCSFIPSHPTYLGVLSRERHECGHRDSRQKEQHWKPLYMWSMMIPLSLMWRGNTKEIPKYPQRVCS